MPIDTAAALAAPPRTIEISWDHKDVQLYHLGLGAGVPATDPLELRYTLESRLHVLPSFATVAGGGVGVLDGLSAPGVDVDLAAVLHGGQHVTPHRPLPVRGEATRSSRVEAVYDKGKAAVIVLRTEAADADGPLWTSHTELYVRGEGGFGGERGPSVRPSTPVREPDRVVERAIREDQALLYRLSGDWNPLHADPDFARLAGFERPILHGLCSYGVALKAVADTLLDGNVARVRGYGTRFTGVVFPGETLRIAMWREGEDGSGGGGVARLEAVAVERDGAPVLGDAVVTYGP
ncbi:3-alpha,7-alpha,12-alpha-trihydroxy-5-beta-cholest-24-enoyl-CoA hydratase [Streptomyces armeniacus]|uniref:3-alpha,7-alpha, 12-alpha-trihydroxy-5-beta-cholest-24-enoyl-CoA hydratase n=1 Tax=Streptomyces armeniacus TaxID=83291 RepID=A0A345XTI0_9ACTN|nr:MaoC/PaaZ C-terminal domain-containing protein [Streptomyces armeniacus]AXK34946.1 3-alpha,7-alpha,12-alpha-trihydroxy-5-beta-cholest-24-enoyl-CoA hydratase [Streptomyces armeniacus]